MSSGVQVIKRDEKRILDDGNTSCGTLSINKNTLDFLPYPGHQPDKGFNRGFGFLNEDNNQFFFLEFLLQHPLF